MQKEVENLLTNGLAVPNTSSWSFPCLLVDLTQTIGKLDFLKGCWKVPLTQRAAEISAFVTPGNFLQYTVKAFGMCNAPSTFQRLMWAALASLANCEAYLEDVLVYSPDWESHMKTLLSVYQLFKNASLTLNLSNCEFSKAAITYLGNEVGAGSGSPPFSQDQCCCWVPSVHHQTPTVAFSRTSRLLQGIFL